MSALNAKFTFHQGKDTVDMKNPRIKGNEPVQFVIDSRKEIVSVSYEASHVRGHDAVSHTKTISRDGYISIDRISLKPRDKVFVKIVYLEDKEGKKYKPYEDVYSFVIE